MIIGLSLIQVGLTSIGGGYAAMADHTFGAPKKPAAGRDRAGADYYHNRQRNPYLRIASLVIAMAAGYLAAWLLDMLPANTAPTESSLIMVPTPLYYGLGIDWNLLLPLMLVFMITSLETIGDITATSDVSEQPVSGPLYEASEGRRAGQRSELVCFGGIQHLPELLLWPEQRRDTADRRRQPLCRFRGRADADRARPVPGGKRLRAAYS